MQRTPIIKSIDTSMTSQFMNLINYTEGENKTVTILPRKGNEDERKYKNEVDPKGNVYIFYNRSSFNNRRNATWKLACKKRYKITENDFNIRKHERVRCTKENARDVLIENELIQMKLSGLNINEVNLMQRVKETKDQTISQIFNDESHDLRRIRCIEKFGTLNFRKSQRYVIGQYLAGRFSTIKNPAEAFLELNYEVGNVDADINKVVDDLREI